MIVFVLMQNDYPIGVYTDEQGAMFAATEHYEARYKYTNRPMEDFHYRPYEFALDKAAK